MKIAIDIDDVLANFNIKFLEFYNTKHNKNLRHEDMYTYDFWKSLGITPEEAYDAVFDFYYSEDFALIAPADGSREVLEKYKTDLEYIVVTSRPMEIEHKTIAWLDKHFPKLFNDIVHTNQFSKDKVQSITKSKVCLQNSATLIIEDSPIYAVDCANNGVEVVIINKPWNIKEDLSESITRVNNWSEIDSYLSKN